MNIAVVMLSKSPVVDCCKTRLTDRLTQQQANALQAALIEDILANVLSKHVYDFWVAGPTSESLAYFQRFTSRLLVQCGNDLGERMADLTCRLFSAGYDKVILIGSDMPLMTSKLLDQAINELETHECVLGPAADGGYYLIGFRCPIHEVFHGVQWSTSTVLSETMKIINQVNHTYALLPQHRDIDSWSDILFYANEVSSLAELSNTLAWMQSHVQMRIS